MHRWKKVIFSLFSFTYIGDEMVKKKIAVIDLGIVLFCKQKLITNQVIIENEWILFWGYNTQFKFVASSLLYKERHAFFLSFSELRIQLIFNYSILEADSLRAHIKFCRWPLEILISINWIINLSSSDSVSTDFYFLMPKLMTIYLYIKFLMYRRSTLLFQAWNLKNTFRKL